MALIKKLKILMFWILEFYFHEATLDADLAHPGCVMDMVDDALER